MTSTTFPFRCSSVVERLTVNQDVAGSSPATGANLLYLVSWGVRQAAKALDFQSSYRGFESRTPYQPCSSHVV